MKKILNRLLAGFLSLAAVFTTLPASQVHAAETQYWTESAERAGHIEKVMNDGSIGSTFNEGIMKVEGETAYCIDINTAVKRALMQLEQVEQEILLLRYVNEVPVSDICNILHISRFALYRKTKKAVEHFKNILGEGFI